MSGGTAFFSLVQTFLPRMRKCFGSPILSLQKKNQHAGVLPGIDISVDCTGINVTQEPCVSGLLEAEVRDGFMQTGTPKLFCCKHGGSQHE